jgi:hypothetical protein
LNTIHYYYVLLLKEVHGFHIPYFGNRSEYFNCTVEIRATSIDHLVVHLFSF